MRVAKCKLEVAELNLPQNEGVSVPPRSAFITLTYG